MRLTLIIHESRSGSTYFSKLLADNYDIIIPPEEKCISKILGSIDTGIAFINKMLWKKYILNDEKISDWNINLFKLIESNENFVNRKSIIISLLHNYKEINYRDLDINNLALKKGSYIFHCDYLVRIFPDIKIILLIRDGRGVYNSKKKTIHTLKNKPLARDLEYEAKRWANTVYMYTDLIKKYPNNTYLIKYEELLMNLDMVGKIADFIGLSKSKEYSYSIPERYNEIHRNIYSDPKIKYISKWRNELSRDEIDIYQKVAGSELEKLGYSLI